MKIRRKNSKKIDWDSHRFSLLDIVMVTVLLLVGSALITWAFTSSYYHKQACERGFASWKVVNSSTGRTEFKWTEPTDTTDIDEVIAAADAQANIILAKALDK